MSLFLNLEDIIRTAALSPPVEMAALGVSGSSSWSRHITVDTVGFIAEKNRGNLPFIEIRRNGPSTYSAESMGPSRGGTVDSSYNICVTVGNISRRQRSLSEEKAYGIVEALLQEIRSKWDFIQGSETISELESHPFGYSLNVTIDVSNSWGDR